MKLSTISWLWSRMTIVVAKAPRKLLNKRFPAAVFPEKKWIKIEWTTSTSPVSTCYGIINKLKVNIIRGFFSAAIVGVSSGLAVFAIVGAGFCYHRWVTHFRVQIGYLLIESSFRKFRHLSLFSSSLTTWNPEQNTCCCIDMRILKGCRVAVYLRALNISGILSFFAGFDAIPRPARTWNIPLMELLVQEERRLHQLQEPTENWPKMPKCTIINIRNNKWSLLIGNLSLRMILIGTWGSYWNGFYCF